MPGSASFSSQRRRFRRADRARARAWKAGAWVLLVLTLLPFTAPFPTFDLGALTHASDAASRQGRVAPEPSAAGLTAVNTLNSQPPGEESVKELSASKGTVTITETVLLSSSHFRTIGSLSPRATLGFARRTPTLRL